MEMISLTIDNKEISVPKGTTILEAAKKLNIKIPTLCFLKGINEIGACRVCVVQVEGARNLVASCVQPVAKNMKVFTNTPKIIKARRTTLELLLSNHNRSCLSCVKNLNCELQTLCKELGIENESRFDGEKSKYKKDKSTSFLVRDNEKCILCRRCVAACKNQHVAVIGANNRGFDTFIGCAFESPLSNVPCTSCGQCVVACPTGALHEKNDIPPVLEAINDPNKIVIVNTAPSIRATLGECFDLPIGTNIKGKMIAALRKLGFDKIFDTDFGADLTIIEEANEFINRLQNNGPFPLITSCSPGWIKFCEHYFPEFLDRVSSCKSPQQMTGAIIKTWYAKKNNIDPKNIVTVSIMPCTAKKFELNRPYESACGEKDIDFALTTRELARMIKQSGIDFINLKDEEFDSLLGESTGAGVIFAASGGVMEAALRTANDILTGENLEKIDYNEVRGMQNLKEATYNINDKQIKVGVVSGLENTTKVLEKIKSGEKFYHFLEVMCCPGGCLNGGGQPIQSAQIKNSCDIKSLRAKAIYQEDKNMPLRKAHQNPTIKELYKEFLEKPGSEKAHNILHTKFFEREKY